MNEAEKEVQKFFLNARDFVNNEFPLYSSSQQTELIATYVKAAVQLSLASNSDDRLSVERVG